MKNFKKKIVALGLSLATMASSVMSISASAADYYDWGPNYWTPDTGSFYAGSSYICVENLEWGHWDLVQISKDQMGYGGGILTSEFEFRPSTKPSNLWTEITSFSSNLPSSFKEFDKNDVTIGTRKVENCVTGPYYGRLYLTPKSTADVSQETYIFESEYGIWLSGISDVINDSQPLKYEQYGTCNFLRTYNW